MCGVSLCLCPPFRNSVLCVFKCMKKDKCLALQKLSPIPTNAT